MAANKNVLLGVAEVIIANANKDPGAEYGKIIRNAVVYQGKDADAIEVTAYIKSLLAPQVQNVIEVLRAYRQEREALDLNRTFPVINLGFFEVKIGFSKAEKLDAVDSLIEVLQGTKDSLTQAESDALQNGSVSKRIYLTKRENGLAYSVVQNIIKTPLVENDDELEAEGDQNSIN